MLDTGFPYSANSDAKILILGSMPGRKSLDEQQYYAHPHNSFWRIMGELFVFDTGLPYTERLATLRKHGVALWDVAHQCIRPGSLDSAIETSSVVANDFASLFADHPQLGALFFNGQKAFDLYRRLVLPTLSEPLQQLPRTLLPSTSPAHAAMRFEEKLSQWRQIKAFL